MIPDPSIVGKTIYKGVAGLFKDEPTRDESGVPIYSMNDEEDDTPINLVELQEYYAVNEATEETPLDKEDLKELGIKSGPETAGKQKDDNSEAYEPMPAAEEPNEISLPSSFTENLQNRLKNFTSQLASQQLDNPILPQISPLPDTIIHPPKPQEKSNLPLILMMGIPVVLILVLSSRKQADK